MEKLQSQISLFQVAEINVIYNPKFKSSERPNLIVSENMKQPIIRIGLCRTKNGFIEEFFKFTLYCGKISKIGIILQNLLPHEYMHFFNHSSK